MLELKTRPVMPVLLLSAAIALVGCSASKDGPKYPQPIPTTSIAKFNITTGDLPYPSDPFFFIGTTDGTLNLPTIAFRASYIQAALNALDGWSTSSVVTTGFSSALDPASISGSTVAIIKLWINPENKGPVDVTDPQQWKYLPAGWDLTRGPVAGILRYGTDFTAVRSSDSGAALKDFDSDGKFLEIIPLKPWDFSRGPAVTGDRVLNVGYLVLLTNGLKSAENGSAMGSDSLYSSLRSADCTKITDATQNGLCKLIQGQLKIAALTKPFTGIDPASVILSWNFSTESIDDTLNVITLTAQPQETVIVPTGASSPQGKADLFVGYTNLPYFLTPPANSHDGDPVLTKFWTAANPPPPPLANPAGQTVNYLTMFNPVPAVVSLQKVPLLVTIPKTSSPSACTGMPPGGWPVAIVQHGLGGDRTQAITMADSFADQCFIVAAIDIPLHGITIPYDPNPTSTNPLTILQSKISCAGATPSPACLGAHERTFDLDIVNNTTGALTAKNPATGYYVGDGKIDPSSGYSGTTFFNLKSPLTARDNLRQAEVDIVQLTKSLPGLAIAPGTPLPAGPVGVNPERINFVGLSLGAIVGGSHIHFNHDLQTATISAPGGTISQLLNDSAYFGKVLRSIVAAGGATPDSYVSNLVLRDVQAAIDAGDPINHIKDAQAMHPTFLIKVLGDGVIPNNSTDRLIAAGGLTKLWDTTQGNPVGPGTGAYSVFKVGSHGTLFDPTTSLSATMEMQAETVGFAASAVAPGGPYVYLGLIDSSVLDLTH